MRPRLDSAAQNRQDLGVWRRQQPGRNRRYSRGAQLRNQTAVHHRQRLACLGAKEHDHRQMGGQAASAVVGIKIDQLGPHNVAVDGGHQAHEAVVFRNRNHATNRLQHSSAGKVGERPLHGRNELFQLQRSPDGSFIEEANGHGGIGG